MIPSWSDSFSIKNARIDKQHMKLFDLAKQAYILSSRNASKEEMRQILAGFFDYMKVHFRDEEEYMAAINYPELEAHKQIHRFIVQRMAELIKQIHNVNDLKENLVVIAKEWLLQHILQEDMKIEIYRRKAALEHTLKETHEDKKYYYICGCNDKVHTINTKIHQKIQQGAKFKCKICEESIAFYDDFYE